MKPRLPGQVVLADTRAMIERAPWNDAFDPDAGVIQHISPPREELAP